MSISSDFLAQPIDQSWVRVTDSPTLERPGLPEKAPPNSLLFSELVYVGTAEIKSSHDVKKMVISTNEDQGKLVYFKKCNTSYPPILAQVEGAGSSSMRLTRGNNAARVRPVVDEEGNVVGAASYEISTFEPLSKESLSVGVMVRFGIIDELVARYVRMEDDLHGDQIGIATDLGIVGLDYDELWYPEITVEIKGARAINNGILGPLPKDLFPVTDKDIDDFPNIVDAQPCHWPTKFPGNLAYWKRFPNQAEFVKLSFNPMAIKQKYYAFLREILIDPVDHLQVMEPNFSRDKAGSAMFKKMKDCVIKRWERQLFEGLVHNSGFRRYIVHNKTSILGILDHFKKYNRELAENGATIDLTKVEKRFQTVVRRCMGKDLTLVLYDLGCALKADRTQWESCRAPYLALIDVCEQFEKSDCSFPEAFFTFECELRNISLSQREKMEEWNCLTKNVNQVGDNYRGLVTEKMGMPVHSILIDQSRKMSVSLSDEPLDKEKCIAKAVVEMLEDLTRHQEVVNVVQKVFDEYVPSGHSSMFGQVNPFAYSRTRTDNITKLISNLKERPGESALLISEFISTGGWNTSGYMFNASANVILIRSLVEKSLENFKSQMTIKQLRKHDLVEISFAIEHRELNIEQSAQAIGILFKQIMKKEESASSLEEPADIENA